MLTHLPDAATDRLVTMVEELRAQQQRLSEQLAAAQWRHADRLLVRNDGRIIVVRVDQIECIEAAHNNVIIHVGTQQLRMRERLHTLHARLNPSNFVRIHRSTIVNVDCVRELQPWFAGDSIVILRSGRKLRLSRTYRREWERWVGSTGDETETDVGEVVLDRPA